MVDRRAGDRGAGLSRVGDDHEMRPRAVLPRGRTRWRAPTPSPSRPYRSLSALRGKPLARIMRFDEDSFPADPVDLGEATHCAGRATDARINLHRSHWGPAGGCGLSQHAFDNRTCVGWSRYSERRDFRSCRLTRARLRASTDGW